MRLFGPALLVEPCLHTFVARLAGSQSGASLAAATNGTQTSLLGSLSLLALPFRRRLRHAGQFGPNPQKSFLRPLALYMSR